MVMKTNKTLDALIFEDVENSVFTITLLEKGGPTISAPTFDEAKKKFETALKVSVAIWNLSNPEKDAIINPTIVWHEFK